MDYKYVAGADALFSKHRKPSTLKVALISGVVFVTGVLFTQQFYKKNKTSTVAATPVIAAASITPVVEQLPQANPDLWRWTAMINPIVAKPLSELPLLKRVVPELVSQAVATVKESGWETITVKKGDTLGKIFNRLGLKTDITSRKSSLKQATMRIATLKPGSTLKILAGDKKNVQQLSYALNDLETLNISLKGKKYVSNIERAKTETKLAYFGTSIEQSLARSAQKNGLEKELTAQLASIFKDRVNVAQLKRGDYFNMLYQEEYVGNKKVGTGQIVAAQIINKGKTHRAVQYADAKGRTEYYTPEGENLRKLGFTRIPLQSYSYISSTFGWRSDPLHGRGRSHQAVDFAAPSGTPIKAASTGKVTSIGYKGAYGKAIEIQHPGNITTLYAHMSRFNASVKPGTQVQQGQVIGYVGSTGRSTGAHLHYEMRVAGIPKDPMTISLPSAAPLDKAAKARFIPKARGLMAQLEMGRSVKLAALNTTTNPSKPKPKDA